MAMEKLLVFWDMMPHNLIICNNELEILGASLFTVGIVKTGSYISDGN